MHFNHSFDSKYKQYSSSSSPSSSSSFLSKVVTHKLY